MRDLLRHPLTGHVVTGVLALVGVAVGATIAATTIKQELRSQQTTEAVALFLRGGMNPEDGRQVMDEASARLAIYGSPDDVAALGAVRSASSLDMNEAAAVIAAAIHQFRRSVGAGAVSDEDVHALLRWAVVLDEDGESTLWLP